MTLLEEEFSKMANGHMLIDFEFKRSDGIQAVDAFIEHFQGCGFGQCIKHDCVHPSYVNVCLKVDVKQIFDVFQVIDEQFVRQWEKDSLTTSYHYKLPQGFKAILMMSKRFKVLNVLLQDKTGNLVLENYVDSHTDSIEYELFHILTGYWHKSAPTLNGVEWHNNAPSALHGYEFSYPILHGFHYPCRQVGSICSDFQSLVEHSMHTKEVEVKDVIKSLKKSLQIAESELQQCKANESKCKLQAAIIGQ